MAGIEAQAHPFGIGFLQEPADLLVGLDVALGVRVEREPHPGLLVQDAGEVAGALGQRAPLVRVEAGGLELAAIGQVAVHRREEHHVPGAERAGQPCDLQHPRLDGGQFPGLVQRAADRAAGQAQAAGFELGAQGGGVSRQVAVRAELQPPVRHRDRRGGDALGPGPREAA